MSLFKYEQKLIIMFNTKYFLKKNKHIFQNYSCIFIQMFLTLSLLLRVSRHKKIFLLALIVSCQLRMTFCCLYLTSDHKQAETDGNHL